ncbi:nitroreductase [Mycolicibacterium sp. BK556]|uniref:nitroreductase family protein n=1 Tax=unclassified Mycolicibacterium TaxID=2636767 RepID=UPI00161BAC74|nr:MULTISPECIES: nitroreductase family protein [unclassified Mycolicibacterium]MBB3604885.1 nitroreductase [Mycolicibacterium sp. BK556]MBB3634402.1 nitroreductase [Mycolicibacterium sp. BK607]
MDAETLLSTTRSVRKALDVGAPVDLAEIRDCLRIGLQAANGSNQQAWRWVIVTDSSLRAAIADLYRQSYLDKVGGQFLAGLLPAGTSGAALMSSTEWLVEHLAEVPVLVIPCYEPTYPRQEGDESFYLATLYGSIFPAVWNFQLALRTRGYGTCITTLHLHHEARVRDLLGIPETYVQGCLLPVARLRAGYEFRPAPRRPLDEVVAVNGWDGMAP